MEGVLDEDLVGEGGGAMVRVRRGVLTGGIVGANVDVDVELSASVEVEIINPSDVGDGELCPGGFIAEGVGGA